MLRTSVASDPSIELPMAQQSCSLGQARLIPFPIALHFRPPSAFRKLQVSAERGFRFDSRGFCDLCVGASLAWNRECSTIDSGAVLVDEHPGQEDWLGLHD